MKFYHAFSNQFHLITIISYHLIQALITKNNSSLWTIPKNHYTTVVCTKTTFWSGTNYYRIVNWVINFVLIQQTTKSDQSIVEVCFSILKIMIPYSFIIQTKIIITCFSNLQFFSINLSLIDYFLNITIKINWKVTTQIKIKP